MSADAPVLNARQTQLLWRQIIAGSRESQALIDPHSVADWARSAWTLLTEQEIDLDQAERGDANIELRALRGWCRTYRDALAQRGWQDASDALRRIVATGTPAIEPRAAQLLDCTELTPLEQRSLARLEADGWTLEAVTLPVHTPVASRATAPNITEEITRASRWCLDRSAANPNGLVALVVPPNYAPAELVERLLAPWPAVTFAASRRSVSDPAVASALNALTLLSPGGGARELSHWLRSSFFHGPALEDAAAAARFEGDLRGLLVAQLPFLAAYREGGLAELVEARTPTLAERLRRAVERIDGAGRSNSPSRWTEIWRACLRDLEWLAGSQDTATRAIQVLDVAFSEFAKLTAVAPLMSLEQALAELHLILDEPLLPARMPITGIHVLNHIDEIGPGYDGVWAVGFSDRAWPERRRPNPLLPRALQARHRLPWSSPEDALARSRRSIARVSAIAPEVILSWSQHDSEAERLPSPLIKALAEAEPERRGLHGPSRSRDDGRNELVTLADPAPALAERRVPGGAGTLNQQARCPVRAFVERRLGAKPLIPWTRGVSARLRGIIVHDAAARLLSTQLTRSALAAMTTAQLADRIETSANRALERAFGRLRSHLKTVHDLEHERLVRTLRKLVDAELARGDFEIVASESKAIITLGEWEIHARLDRLDRLATGGLAIIDYKTGTNASPDWFGPVLGDAQVPLYALHVGPEVTAAVLCSVSHDGARYRGYWLGQTAFPGSSQSQSMTWPELLARWSSQLEDLTAAFAAGDVRIRLDNAKDVEGLLAPLTRIYELRALCAAEEA